MHGDGWPWRRGNARAIDQEIVINMSMILVAVLALVINCDGLSSYLSRPAMIDSSQSVYIKTYVLNCFPSSDITAFITFERDRVSRLRYGKVAIVNATLQPNSDFVIQFRQKLTDSK